MTSIVYDYADIRSRMLGEDRPRREKPEIDPVLEALMRPPMLNGSPRVVIGVDPARPGSDQTIIRTKPPPGTWRKIEDEWREIVKRYGL